MTNTYKKTLDQAREDLALLIEQREALDTQIARVTKTVEALTAMCDDTDHSKNLLVDEIALDSLGVTDAIRHILAESRHPLSVPQIRDALEARGLHSERYANFLTVIHNTLKRLEKQGQATKVGQSGNAVVWASRQRTIGDLIRGAGKK